MSCAEPDGIARSADIRASSAGLIRLELESGDRGFAGTALCNNATPRRRQFDSRGARRCCETSVPIIREVRAWDAVPVSEHVGRSTHARSREGEGADFNALHPACRGFRAPGSRSVGVRDSTLGSMRLGDEHALSL
jgi:hypothetical protein